MNLTEINRERSKIINTAMRKIWENRERGRRYTSIELSEMCEGLITPDTFRECFRRAEWQAREDEQRTPNARWQYSDKSHLFGQWSLTFKVYPVTRECVVKWYDGDGKVVKITSRTLADYEVEFF